MIDAGQQRAEHLAVIDDAAHRGTAEADAMITALAADQAGAGALALGLVIGQRDLQRGVGGLEPELQKNTWSRPAGARSAMRLASSKACGMPNWNGGA